MLRALALAVALITSLAPTAHAEAPAPPVAEADPVFPLPKDAQAPAAVKGGGGKIQTYNVPRGRGPVVEELRGALKAGKWEIVKDEASPSGNATRIQAKKAGKLWRVSVTGDDTRAVIILTVP
ncbi:MAG: hypothetical protein JNL83_21455 [Myxococcales bacterium]|nr:hypothetical protein [Myxococcales bacterium]